MNLNNDLLERYLQAIGEHLSTAAREDVLAELRANLQAQLDDRAEELNRPLTDADIAPILLFVANFWMGMSCRIVFLIGLLALLIEAWKHYGPTLRSRSLAF
jgi:hypothetical protein